MPTPVDRFAQTVKPLEGIYACWCGKTGSDFALQKSYNMFYCVGIIIFKGHHPPGIGRQGFTRFFDVLEQFIQTFFAEDGQYGFNAKICLFAADLFGVQKPLDIGCSRVGCIELRKWGSDQKNRTAH